MNVSAFDRGVIVRCVSVIILSLFSQVIFAKTVDVNSKELSVLAESNEWRSLLHYEIANNRDTGSQIDDSDFFLSELGSQDLRAELDATINAFYYPVTQINDHAVCRFPARFEWLQARIDLSDVSVSLEQCSEMTKWFNDINPHKTVLVFASAYLNSPSSMFGHTFLRIDPEGVEQGSKWLSYAINFGAELTGQDGSIAYAYKGLVGGYPGFFSVIPYFEKIKEYNQIENRDLWEYELNLTPEETRRLVVHLWELKDINFDYYFFDENCSYRLLELLEVARPGISLREAFDVKAIPVDTVRAAIEGGLVSEKVYRASAATKIDELRRYLTSEEQDLAWGIAHQKVSLEDPRLKASSEQKKIDTLTLAYQHLRFVQRKKPRDKALAAHSLNILKQLQRRTGHEHPVSVPDYSPDEGHESMLLGWKVGHDDQMDQSYSEVRVRASYHDLLDNTQGYLKGAAINIGEIVVRKAESESLSLELLNFVDINSHSPQSLFYKPITWRVTAGFERVYAEEESYLAPRIEGGAGVTLPMGSDHSVYALAMLRPEYNEILDRNMTLGSGLLVGALFHTGLGTAQWESRYFSMDGGERVSHKAVWNLPLTVNQALRFDAVYTDQFDHKAKQYSVEYRRYF